ncbi:hypothetical protein AgCh_009516 [Apium graveolens]
MEFHDECDSLNIDFNNSVAVLIMMGSNKKINMWTLDDDGCLRGGGVEASGTPMFSIDLGADILYTRGHTGPLESNVDIGIGNSNKNVEHGTKFIIGILEASLRSAFLVMSDFG